MNLLTLEEKLKRNYDELHDPALASDLVQFIDEYSSSIPPGDSLFIKRFVKCARNIAKGKEQPFSLSHFQFLYSYIHLGIQKIDLNDVGTESLSHSAIEKMQAHLFTDGGMMATKIAERFASPQEKKVWLEKAYDDYEASIRISPEDLPNIIPQYVEQGEIAFKLANLTEDYSTKRRWLESAVDKYSKAIDAQKGKSDFYVHSFRASAEFELSKLLMGSSERLELLNRAYSDFTVFISNCNSVPEKDKKHLAHQYGFRADVARTLAEITTTPKEQKMWLERAEKDGIEAAQRLVQLNILNAAYQYTYNAVVEEKLAGILSTTTERIHWLNLSYQSNLECMKRVRLFDERHYAVTSSDTGRIAYKLYQLTTEQKYLQLALTYYKIFTNWYIRNPHLELNSMFNKIVKDLIPEIEAKIRQFQPEEDDGHEWKNNRREKEKRHWRVRKRRI